MNDEDLNKKFDKTLKRINYFLIGIFTMYSIMFIIELLPKLCGVL